MNVQVVRSPKRRKTVEARIVDGVLRLSIPARMSHAEEAHWIDEMRRRFERRSGTAAIDLRARAATLAAKYRLPTPASVRWVSNQGMRWGSCTPADGTIRLSDRLAGAPAWVIDAVLVHELAHLVVVGHGPDFHELANRFPHAERARGFLEAWALRSDTEPRRDAEGTGTVARVIVGIDHVQLAMPAGAEAEAAAEQFYAGVLGLTRVPKPDPLAVRGGCWFEAGAVRIHLGVEEGFRPARKAHPALAVASLDDAIARLRAAGIDVEVVPPTLGQPDLRQAYVADPFGNRIELIERS